MSWDFIDLAISTAAEHERIVSKLMRERRAIEVARQDAAEAAGPAVHPSGRWPLLHQPE